MVEQRVRVAFGGVRICDLALLRADAPREKATETAPLLCIEILSREDRNSRAEGVLADYRTMGVHDIWLIDPIRKAAYTFDAGGLQIADPANLTITGIEIKLDLTGASAAIG